MDKGLLDYLPHSRIQIIQRVSNWQQAVQICAKPLLDENIITDNYIKQIYTIYDEIGPYFVIAPRIAMPHARPEDGALKHSLSLLVIKDGINFNSENDPVNLVLMLAAEDSNSHIHMLTKVSSLFDNNDDIESIIQADTTDQINKIISKY